MIKFTNMDWFIVALFVTFKITNSKLFLLLPTFYHYFFFPGKNIYFI